MLLEKNVSGKGVIIFYCPGSRVSFIYPLWGGGFQPLAGPDRGSFFHCGVVGFQPLAGTCYIYFSQILDSECAYVPVSVRMAYFDHHSCSPHPFSGNPMLPRGQTKGCFP